MSYLFRALIGLGLILAPLAMMVRSQYLSLGLALSAIFCLILVAVLEVFGLTGATERRR